MNISEKCGRVTLNSTVGVCALIGAIVLPASQALAQEAQVTSFDEIFVTARKLTENLQDVPISISAFTGDSLAEAGIFEFADVSKLSSNFTALPQGAFGTAFPNLTIRGQTSGFLTLNADQAVGVYVNGAPIPRAAGLFNNLFDIERIEVLKGPQGTLFGRNTTGGAINVVTKAPEFNDFSGYVRATVGNYSRHDFEGVLNVPVVDDTLAVRVGAIKTNRDGFGRGQVTGLPLADDDEFAFRGSVLFKPSDIVSFQINGNYIKTDEAGSIARSLRTVLFGVVSQESTDPDIFVGNEFGTIPQTDEFEEWSINMTASVELDAVLVESITSYRKHDAFFEYRRIPLTGNVIFQEADVFAQELRFSGLAFSDRLQWQFGAFYSTESGEDADFLPELGQFELTSAANSSIAVFTQNTFAVTDRLNLTFGLRFTDEHREVGDLEVGAPIVFAEADFSGWSWLTSLDYQLTDDILVYVNASRGFKSGGIDTADLSNVIEPEFVRNYEAGFKSDLFDDRWRLNFSAFYTDYTNIQRVGFDPSAPVPTPLLQNIAEATIYGFELESTIIPMQGLTLSQSIGHTLPDYDVFLGIDSFGQPADLSDEPFGGPRWQVSLTGRYEFEVGDSANVGLQVNYFYISEDFQGFSELLQTLTVEEATLDGYGLVNAQVDVDFDWYGGVNLSLFATNLANKKYFSAAFITSLGPLGVVSDRITGNPRTWGVRLKKSF